MKTSEFHRSLVVAIQKAEASTSAEIVVSLRPRSGNYRDIYLTLALIGMSLTLTWALFSPQPIAPGWVLPEVILGGAILGLVPMFWPAALRLLATRQRMARQVRTMAQAEFCEAGIYHTRNRTGLLIYLSITERLVEIWYDQGIARQVPAKKLKALRDELQTVFGMDFERKLLEALSLLGAQLSCYLPVEKDDLDELPNAPRL